MTRRTSTWAVNAELADQLACIPILAFNPFWRWAFIPLSLAGDGFPALTTVRHRTAVDRASEFVSECPDASVAILRRAGWRSYHVFGVVRWNGEDDE